LRLHHSPLALVPCRRPPPPLVVSRRPSPSS
jgi:hypothetical protein